MANEILVLLLKVTAAVSIAAIVVLALRSVLRRQFGAGLAYFSWLLLPLAAAASVLPAFTPRAHVEFVASPLAGLNRVMAAPVAEAPHSVAAALLAIWIAGMFMSGAWQLLRYRAFVRRLGPMTSNGSIAIAATAADGPFLMGIWRPTIVLPADFEQRYTADQRELVLAHERMHAQRGDPFANALFALAQCVWWFNPLIHIAGGCFRLDQEYACDQAVMQRHQGSAHIYADAMLNTQLSHQRTPFACQWQSDHPLKERILNLNRPSIGTARRLAGKLTIGLLLAAGGISAWAAQGAAADAPSYSVAMRVHANGTDAAPRIVTRAGEEAVVSIGPDDKRLVVQLRLTPSGDETVYLHSTLSLNGEVMSKPVLLLKKNQPGTIAVGRDGVDFRMEFTVSDEKPAG